MLLVQFSKVSKDYAGNAVFDQLDLEVLTGERIGLVGENGCGKSTLLRLMADLDTPTEGTISRKRRLTMGHLSQEIDPRQHARTVFEVVQEVSDEFTAHLHYQQQLEKQMADPTIISNADALEKVLDAYGKAQERFETLGGYMVEHKAKAVLTGLGFSASSYDQKVGSLSGGEKKLVNLARILVQTPDLLLLDEPDNHLDMDAKRWLEDYIRDYPGTVVIISHDRHLLDHTVKKIFQLEDGTIDTYTGNYTAYVKERQLRLQQRYEYYLTQQDEIKRLEASLVQLREWAKMNDKFAGRMHNMEKRIARIKEDLAEKPVLVRNKMKVQLDPERSSKKVLEVKRLEVSIGSRLLCKPFDLTIMHGERIGIVGDNGSGKSTLLKMLLGLRPVQRGEVKIGPSIVPGYYSQEQETLPFESTPIQFVTRLKNMSEGQAIALLHRLLFSYRDMYNTIGNLSGGEKSRLQIARLMLTDANFLLLDEPTNNLDIPSVEVLETALQQFDGTLLMISHDRYFLDKLATKIIAIEDDCAVRTYPGNYSYYSEKLLCV
ncbi:ABC transporter ATP-binding protein [Dictyobacter vulcani]|uniref:ABC transporter ATP-binding protein n=1 Tax=Dictyobacter vulcani TaxID=2607529 RepID=A0A5J4KKZ2_9CHLR|nr:ABC-F family ATP-binding cassette domain-containing protein [Dictyobacter vulcani]GER86839.1 ABC transporter ATP-binding protein [Dictyobacter vulcani]